MARYLFSQGCFLSAIYCGGYSGEDPPLPIPNREVKLTIADGTAPPGGRVGSCRSSGLRSTHSGRHTSIGVFFYALSSSLSRQRAKWFGNSRSEPHHPSAARALRTPVIIAWASPHTRGQSARETHAPGHITLWLLKPFAPLCYFHTPLCNWLKIKILENAPWK